MSQLFGFWKTVTEKKLFFSNISSANLFHTFSVLYATFQVEKYPAVMNFAWTVCFNVNLTKMKFFGVHNWNTNLHV